MPLINTLTARLDRLMPVDKPKMSVAPVARYSLISLAFHWLTAVLVLSAFVLSAGGPEARVFGSGNRGLLTLHESLGIAVLMMTLLRLAWRLFDAPPANASMPDWMHVSSSATRYSLYSLLALVPLSAIAGSWMKGYPLRLYVFGDVASPWTTSAAVGQSILSLHAWAGDAIIWLAGFHAAAALYHHFILKDEVLRSMLIR